MTPTDLGVFTDILEFQKTGQKGAILASAAKAVSEQDLRDVCIHLLEWLRAAAKYSKVRRVISVRPLHLDSHPWSLALTDLVRANTDFAAAFELIGDNLSLQRTLAVDRVQAVLDCVENNYNPPLMRKG